MTSSFRGAQSVRSSSTSGTSPSRQSEATADRYLGRLLGACHALHQFPLRGMRRDYLLPGLCVIGFERRATIVFTVEEALTRVEIHGVHYGGQDFEAALREEG